jgi:hypothetical protein
MMETQLLDINALQNTSSKCSQQIKLGEHFLQPRRQDLVEIFFFAQHIC